MMAVRAATTADLAEIRHLLAYGRRLYRATGDEDLPALVEHQVSVVGEEGGRLWGFAALAREVRPPTLPPAAPNRVYVRLLALAAGREPASSGSQLLAPAIQQIGHQPAACLLIVHAAEPWLVDPLVATGFVLAEEVQTFRLDLRAPAAQSDPVASALISLRPIQIGDLDAVAQLDAAAFDPLWHYGANALWELLFAGRVQVAQLRERIVGYTAMAHRDDDIHLTRIAVHPDVQGRGIGRLLLADAIDYARREGARGVTLNTQTSNARSQRLYQVYGFRPTRQLLPVYTRLIEPPGS
jgi:[ribosomal protein S18]-alanine N-acetyltransferase